MQIVGRLLGAVPGAVLFGNAIDEACTLWQQNARSERMFCLRYDASLLSWNVMCFGFPVNTLNCIFLTGMLYLLYGVNGG